MGPSAGWIAWCAKKRFVRVDIALTCHRVFVPTSSVATSFLFLPIRLGLCTLLPEPHVLRPHGTFSAARSRERQPGIDY